MLAAALLAVSCGSESSGQTIVPISEFPRTTTAGVELTIASSVESVPKTACFTLPEGTDCEVDITVVTITARVGDRLVRSRINGTPATLGSPSAIGDPTFPMWIRALETDGDMVVAVVRVRLPDHAIVRLISDGKIVDEVRPVHSVAVLASSVGYDDIRLISDQTGDLIASCPLGGMLVGAVIYPCTPPAATPVTTTILTEQSP